MTKQEQIENMIGVMSASNNPFVDVPIEIMPQVAEALYNAGYRKIPENAVVLTMEEFERCKGFSREEVDEISETAIKNARKETAEKFAGRMKEVVSDISFKTSTVGFDGYQSCSAVNQNSIIERIDEICKGITEKGVQNGN